MTHEEALIRLSIAFLQDEAAKTSDHVTKANFNTVIALLEKRVQLF